MIHPSQEPSKLDRREVFQSVGATVAFAAAAGASGLIGGGHVATPSLKASDRAGAGFWPAMLEPEPQWAS